MYVWIFTVNMIVCCLPSFRSRIPTDHKELDPLRSVLQSSTDNNLTEPKQLQPPALETGSSQVKHGLRTFHSTPLLNSEKK